MTETTRELMIALSAAKAAVLAAQPHVEEVRRLADAIDGDHDELAFSPLFAPSPNQPVTLVSAWVARVDRFLNEHESDGQ